MEVFLKTRLPAKLRAFKCPFKCPKAKNPKKPLQEAVKSETSPELSRFIIVLKKLDRP